MLVNPYRYKTTTDAFVFKVNSGSNGKFLVGTDPVPIYIYNYNLTTSDGQTITGQTGDYEITFPNTNTDYIVEISGVFPQMVSGPFNPDSDKILDVLQWGTQPWASMAGMFHGCSQLSSFSATDTPDLSNVTSMYQMFAFATSFNGDIGNWNVSNVVDMSWMFYDATSFNQNIGNWDVSNVTNMEVMFLSAELFNQDLSSWCVQNIPSKPSGFDNEAWGWALPRPVWGTCPNPDAFIFKVNSSSNGKFPIKTNPLYIYDYNITTSDGQTILNRTGNYEITFPNTNTDYIIEITGVLPHMWYGGIGNIYHIVDVLQWGNQPWASMADMFRGCKQLYSFSATDVPDLSNVTDISGMFHESSFNGDIGDWDVSGVTNMRWLFRNSSFNGDISGWDVGNVTNMSYIFSVATSFNQNISNWNVGNVNDMSYMFALTPFNQDISGWNVSNVTNMGRMFNNATSFNQDLSSWCVQNIPSKPASFDDGATSWTSPKPVWGTCPP